MPDGDEPLELPDDGITACECIEQRERAERLRNAIDGLSPKRKAVVVLHDLEELSIDDIAGMLGINPLTVRSRLRDGRSDLGRLLRNDPWFGDSPSREVDR